MKIGVSVANYGPMPSREFLLKAAIETEKECLDSIWTSDHIIVPKDDLPWNRVYESLTTLSFFSSITEKISLGTSILLVPLRDPFLLAKQIATLDSLSGGRVSLGVGVGWNKKEFHLLDKSFVERTKNIENKKVRKVNI